MGQLTLKNVVKSFGQIEVVKHVSLEVQDGEFVVFVGPSGCGKSTLLRMVAGLEHTSGGDIVIDGQRVNDLPPVKRGIAMVFQSYALYPHMSVYENIAFPLRVERASEEVIREKVESAAAILHLDQRLQQKPGMLSGGQRQRVAIGRAIVREPKIFLFDEPLSNLDAALRADMRIELTRLHKQLGATMIYVTHDQVEAMTMADRIVVLNAGYIAQVGAPLELYHKPQNAFVARFIGNPRMNMLPVTCTAVSTAGVEVDLNGQRLLIPVDGLAGMEGKPLMLGIRPEHIQIGRGEANITVTPAVVEQLGQQTIGYAPLPDQEDNFCFVMPGTQVIVEERPLEISFRTEDCHLFNAEGEAYERRIDLSAMTEPPVPLSA
ncbi:sn-glycerol-3-phosphate ABC transporter ATP-binding protein UgpC [Paracoccus zhejiangensis]|uniref:ABC transporter ATP-binding protein n=1 Tax=Paracoccus zhejiangensis TaxID=1077935 RepID=A0A2H5EY71_9RHOB|nr:sn-glycerol-3-phosphate ABC transporter ATP-binding protein UgpC [Paracoccus zhejiangensis]AUH64256.1 ABC transporter ATP-binding protein [Paracoccus zhejiangensis]